MRRMPGAGERAYAYAKACGIVGKSFVGKRIRRLEEVSRLSELDRMVFPLASRDLPEKELLLDLEKRITARSVNSIISIVKSFSDVPEFLKILVRSYEYADLKTAISSIQDGDSKAPVYTDIGEFQTVRFDAWPNMPAMIRGTEFEFLLDKKVVKDEKQAGILMQTLLDRHYYGALWESLFSLPPNDRYAAEKILSDEISLRNSGWALRLRTYYRMTAEEVKSHLVIMPTHGKSHYGTATVPHSLAHDALACLEFPLDNQAAWSAWRWNDFLNPESGGRPWKVDPRHFQNAASLYLYRLSRRYFRSRPFSLDTVFCFIKLKQFEEDMLTSSVEGLGMGMSSRDIFSMLGVES